MAISARWAGVLVTAVVIASASGRFVVEENSVTVIQPKELRGAHQAAIANYGVPDYGGSLVGVVLYPDGAGSKACAAFPAAFKSDSGRPVVLLVDRGDCFFALKTWNAQKAGAAAALVADNIEEPLVTMQSPMEIAGAADILSNITIPSSLINKKLGDRLKSALKGNQQQKPEVVVRLDWKESMPHPDERVEYEFWTNSNDECGLQCDEQMDFVSNFRGHAQVLEKGGYTLFTPHYITWYCLEAYLNSQQCRSQCINHGRYCAPDPEMDFGTGYDGKDVVIENLRQLCVHRIANESRKPWVWWDFVVDYHVRCSMKNKKYSKTCAEDVVRSLGLPLDEINKCMGDPDADTENLVLAKEQLAQVGHGERGDVTILPTLVINNIQYRGKLERTAVLKAICAGFKESTEPHICLTPDMETNECAGPNNGGCWQDKNLNATACKDTFRGRVCECPVVNGVLYQGDPYKSICVRESTGGH